MNMTILHKGDDKNKRQVPLIVPPIPLEKPEKSLLQKANLVHVNYTTVLMTMTLQRISCQLAINVNVNQGVH